MSEQANCLYGLNYDYIERDGNYIVFYKESQLTVENLARLEVQMLQCNVIPNLLPFEKYEMNDAVQLLYRFTDRRRLTDVLRTNTLSITDYYAMLLNIIMILDNSKAYMLREEQYVLHEDFIFVGRDKLALYLCYLPLTAIEGKESIQEGLERITLHFISFVKDITGQGFQKLITMIRDPNTTLHQLKTQLELLMIDGDDDQMSPQYLNTTFAVPKFDENELWQAASDDDGALTLSELPSSDEPLSTPINEHFKVTTLFSRMLHRKIMGYIAAILLSGMIVMLYLSHPNEGMLFICLGFIVLIGDGVYLLNKHFKHVHLDCAKESVAAGKLNVALEHIVPEQYYNDLPDHTMMLNEWDKTVLLKHSLNAVHTVLDQGKTATFTQAYIQMSVKGEVQHIDLDVNPYPIGRDRVKFNDLIDPIGVSRLHCEFSLAEEGWQIKDLGSNNGTMLNGVQLVPYKLYELQDGDEIIIVNNKLVFRMV